MSRLAVPLTVVGLVVVASSVLFYRLWFAAPRAVTRPPSTLKFAGGGNPIQARIDRMVAQLKSESLKDSLTALGSNNFYSWPGSIESTVEIYKLPLDPPIGQNCIEEILSNRRIRKLLQELAGLSKEEQSHTLTAALKQSLDTYEACFAEFHRSNAPHFAADPTVRVGFGMAISDNPDGSPSLYGSRLAVLGLLLIAANLELHDCRPIVESVSQKARRQRATSENAAQWNMAYRYSMIRRASLYHRQILGTALIATSVDGGIGSQPCDDLGVEWKAVRLTAFDAPATEYDLHHQKGAMPIREQDQVLRVSYLSSLSDEQFVRIVECVKAD
jgi:hypothetical protein